MFARSARALARARGGRPVAWAVVLAAALLASSMGVAVAAASPANPALSSAAASALGPFATRTGFSSSYLAEVPGASPASGEVEVVLTLESPNPAFYASVPTGAPAMTETEIADEYGVSNASYAALEQYFEARGVSVLHAWPSRLSLSLEGSATAVGTAFGTELLSGSYQGRAVSFPRSVPSLPSAFESEIAGVSGLSEGFDTFSMPYTPASPGVTGAAGSTGASTTPIYPSDARDLYDVSPLYNLTASPTYATGKGIVLLLWGWGYDPSDLRTFFTNNFPSSFPTPTLDPYPVDGAMSPGPNAPNDPSNGSRELTLDLEWSGSMAPGATLDAVYAPPGPASDGYSPSDAAMEDAINTAVTPSDVPNVAVISMSFGSADGQDPPYQAAFESAFQQAADEHITLFAATGDTGGDAPSSGGGCSGTVQPEYPAASTQVVAVGGTVVTPGLLSGYSETAWSDSGGGYSAEYRAPSWQLVGSAAAPIEAAGGYRGMPDVAATASYNYLYFGGQMDVGDGTSFATPLWAGIVAEMDALRGSNFGFLTPALYALGASSSAEPSAFHDITSGSNCVGSAGPGWDPVTGWGSPDAIDLYEHLVSAFVNVTLTASPGLIAPGGSVAITAIVTNATSGAAIASLPVVLSLGSNGIGGPCSGSFGSRTVTSNASGGVGTSFHVSACYLGSSAVATVLVESDGYYGTASSTVRVNLFGFFPALQSLTTYPANIVLFTGIMAVAILIGAALGRPPRPKPVAPAAVTGPPVVPATPTPPPPAAVPPAPAPVAPTPSPPGPAPAEPVAPPEGTGS